MFSDNCRRAAKPSTVGGCVNRQRSKKELWSPALELEAEVTSARDTSGKELMILEHESNFNFQDQRCFCIHMAAIVDFTEQASDVDATVT